MFTGFRFSDLAWRSVLQSAAVVALLCGLAGMVRGQDAADQFKADLDELKSRFSPQSAEPPVITDASLQPAVHENSTLDEQGVRRIVRETLDDPQLIKKIRGSAYAGYNPQGGPDQKRDGFFIRNEDDTWNLHIHNRLQMRYAFDHFSDQSTRNGKPSSDRAEDRSDFHIAREYLTFNGNAWSKDLYYQVTLQAFTADNERVTLRYDWVDYNILHNLGWADDESPLRDALYLRGGLWKSRFGREFPASDGQLQLVDRALATQAFRADRVRGIDFHGSCLWCEEDRNPDDGKIRGPGRIAYAAELVDGIFSAGQAFGLDNSTTDGIRQVDNNPAVILRLQYDIWRGWYTYQLADGKEAKANDFRVDEHNDLASHEEPALQIGAAYLFQRDDFDAQPAANPLQGRFFGGKDISRLAADVAYKYRGLSLTGEYFYEELSARDSQFNQILPADQQDSQNSQGFYLRGGYFVVPRRLELAARVSGLFTDDLANGTSVPDAWEYTAGLGWYPTGHHYLKFQLDGSVVRHSPLSAEKSEFVSGTHEQDFIVRAQVQLEF